MVTLKANCAIKQQLLQDFARAARYARIGHYRLVKNLVNALSTVIEAEHIDGQNYSEPYIDETGARTLP